MYVGLTLGWVFVTQTAYKTPNCAVRPAGSQKKHRVLWQRPQFEAITKHFGCHTFAAQRDSGRQA